MNGKQIAKRYRLQPNADLEAFYAEGRPVMGLIAHQANWEWIPHGLGLNLKHKIVAVYKQVKDPFVNDFLVKSRSRFEVVLKETKEIGEYLNEISKKKEVFMLMLIADQSPSNPNKAYWTNFLNRDTAFFYGPQKYMTEYNLPAFFFNIKRVKRGYYDIESITLCKDPSTLKEGEIIEKYSQMVEKEALSRPAHWLWSHNRWKHEKPVAEAIPS